MSRRFKTGDYVRIKDDLEVGKIYGKMRFTSEMKKLCGHIARIDFADWNGTYRLNIGGYYWMWGDDMLEPVSLSHTGNIPEFKSDDLDQGKSKLMPTAENLCKLIGALIYAGAEEFTVSYSHGKVSCNAQIDVGEVEEG